jgi:hypothetical protein
VATIKQQVGKEWVFFNQTFEMEQPMAKEGTLQCWFVTKMEDQTYSETLYEKWLK